MTGTNRPADRWEAYYGAVGARPPREFYRQAVRRFEKPGFAIDLGFGAGIETMDLLRRGWRVLAVDQSAGAAERLSGRVGGDEAARLELCVADFATVDLPPADFIWAGLALPFCPPLAFDALWRGIVGALQPGGRFAGDFFGPRHAWAASGRLTVHTRAQLDALAGDLHREYLQEGEGEALTALDGVQDWHMFSLCLARRA